jgi:tRNA/tmRNA/rRNA uracil-C5-methylase (TrmA/RlmC/RlmD family)
VGTELELEVGPAAHGGHCVARHDGRVVFVRHALPGERVTALVTEDRGGSFCRADAIAVHTPSPDRVTPPCPYAGPGRCGGCDWQHATPAAQRRIKAGIVREQLTRLGGLGEPELAALGLTVDAEAEELPGGMFGWRTRVQFAVDPAGTAGLRRHRSHDVVPIGRCLIASAGVTEIGVTDLPWPGAVTVEAVASSAGDKAVVVSPGPAAVPALDPGVAVLVDNRPVRGHARVRERVGERTYLVHAGGFWQVHPAAPEVLGEAVLAALDPRPGEQVLDLYAGAGLFAGVLAGAGGPGPAQVVAVESGRVATADAARNLRDDPVRIVTGRVEDVLARGGLAADLVVLDPPRSGAGAAVVTAIAALAPRAIAYVACDPAALARDVATFAGLGYRLAGLRILDAFPNTQHVECVAALAPA